MWSDVDRVRVDFIRFQRFFFKIVVGPTYNWFRGPHIRWDPLVGPVSPQWGPLGSYGAHGGTHMLDQSEPFTRDPTAEIFQPTWRNMGAEIPPFRSIKD